MLPLTSPSTGTGGISLWFSYQPHWLMAVMSWVGNFQTKSSSKVEKNSTHHYGSRLVWHVSTCVTIGMSICAAWQNSSGIFASVQGASCVQLHRVVKPDRKCRPKSKYDAVLQLFISASIFSPHQFCSHPFQAHSCHGFTATNLRHSHQGTKYCNPGNRAWNTSQDFCRKGFWYSNSHSFQRKSRWSRLLYPWTVQNLCSTGLYRISTGICFLVCWAEGSPSIPSKKWKASICNQGICKKNVQ